MARRRSAEEWRQLVEDLKRSGQTLKKFARARDIRPGTLKWWCWRLRRDARKTPRKHARRSRTEDRVSLVPVVAEPDDRSGPMATPVWELISPSGHELRVYDARGLSVLKAALVEIAGGRRR